MDRAVPGGGAPAGTDTALALADALAAGHPDEALTARVAVQGGPPRRSARTVRTHTAATTYVSAESSRSVAG